MCHIKSSLKNRRKKKVTATANIGSWYDKPLSLGYVKYRLIALRMNKVCAEYNFLLCMFFPIQPKLITLCGIGVVYSCTDLVPCQCPNLWPEGKQAVLMSQQMENVLSCRWIQCVSVCFVWGRWSVTHMVRHECEGWAQWELLEVQFSRDGLHPAVFLSHRQESAKQTTPFMLFISSDSQNLLLALLWCKINT